MIKRFVLSALFLLALMSAANASDPIACNNSALGVTATGETQFIAAPTIPGQKIHLCGYTIVGSGAASVQIMSGTGSNCGTNPTAITPAYPLVAQTVIPDSTDFEHGLKGLTNGAICVNSSTGAAASVLLYYNQH